MKKMVSLFYATRGLWRIVANCIRETIRSSLLAVMHMVSVHIPVLIFLAVFVLAFSGFVLLVIKVLVIGLYPGMHGLILGSIADVLNALNEALSPMVYFKISMAVFFVVALASLFGSVRINRKKMVTGWQRLVEVGKDKR